MSRVFRIIEETRQVQAVEIKSCMADGAERTNSAAAWMRTGTIMERKWKN